jgi:hypothetical protein
MSIKPSAPTTNRHSALKVKGTKMRLVLIEGSVIPQKKKCNFRPFEITMCKICSLDAETVNVY